VIAKVRIAPIERWCKEVMDTIAEEPEISGAPNEAGMWVEIRTDMMRQNTMESCGGKEWALTDKSLDELIARTGAMEPVRPTFICEHMLEMD